MTRITVPSSLGFVLVLPQKSVTMQVSAEIYMSLLKTYSGFRGSNENELIVNCSEFAETDFNLLGFLLGIKDAATFCYGSYVIFRKVSSKNAEPVKVRA